MNLVVDYCKDLYVWFRDGWDRFWFTPDGPETVCLLRILTGWSLFYCHLVWAYGASEFLGANGRISVEFARHAHRPPPIEGVTDLSAFAWSHLYWLQSDTWILLSNVVVLCVLACFTVGLFTRVMAVLSFLITVSFAHRAVGALYGLDQIHAFLAMYLMLAPCGERYSVDVWRKRRQQADSTVPAISTNIALRLIQIHMCIVYLFAGLGKLFGDTWWRGDALWGGFANYEYQTLDMTWTASHPLFINFLTQVTVAWEIAYIALIWNRKLRPLMLLFAVLLHLGIAVCMGMVTFGFIMVVANFAFIPSEFIRSFSKNGNRLPEGQGSGA